VKYEVGDTVNSTVSNTTMPKPYSNTMRLHFRRQIDILTAPTLQAGKSIDRSAFLEAYSQQIEVKRLLE